MPEAAAEALGISRSALYGLIGSGELETITLGRSRRVPRRALATLTGGEPPRRVTSLPAPPSAPMKRTVLLVEIDTLAGLEPEVRVFLNGQPVEMGIRAAPPSTRR